MNFNDLHKQNGDKKPKGRKSWSIDLESAWIPYFIGKNAEGVTAIAKDALGAPLRLAYNPDGTVKFSKRGLPVIKVANDLSSAVRLVRENFEAGLKEEAHRIATEKADAYNAEVKACLEAGKPVMAKDIDAYESAMKKAVAEALAHAEAEAKAKAEAAARLDAELEAVKGTAEAKEAVTVTG